MSPEVSTKEKSLPSFDKEKGTSRNTPRHHRNTNTLDASVNSAEQASAVMKLQKKDQVTQKLQTTLISKSRPSTEQAFYSSVY